MNQSTRFELQEEGRVQATKLLLIITIISADIIIRKDKNSFMHIIPISAKPLQIWLCSMRIYEGPQKRQVIWDNQWRNWKHNPHRKNRRNSLFSELLHKRQRNLQTVMGVRPVGDIKMATQIRREMHLNNDSNILDLPRAFRIIYSTLKHEDLWSKVYSKPQLVFRLFLFVFFWF